MKKRLSLMMKCLGQTIQPNPIISIRYKNGKKSDEKTACEANPQTNNQAAQQANKKSTWDAIVGNYYPDRYAWVARLYLARLTLKQEYLTQTTWVLPLLILAGLLTVVAAIGLWQWKKWGIYLYVTTQIMAMVAHLILTGSLYVVFYDAIPLLILGYVLNEGDRLRYFD